MAEPPPIPYCGAPPVPHELWSRWNLDPVLIAALALALAGYLWAARRTDLPTWRRSVFVAGWATASLALVSPLCPLSVALFSARVGQHMILTAVAAPLLALGRPGRALAALLPGGDRPALPGYGGPFTAAVAFACALWFWHAPGPYGLTFQSTAAYWLMHLTLFGSALWLWGETLHDAQARLAGLALAVALTTLQMGLLGAVLTFAPRPLYGPHVLATLAWGLSPLDDQQLGGAIMWAPAGVIFVAGLVGGLAMLMRPPERRPLPAPIPEAAR